MAGTSCAYRFAGHGSERVPVAVPTLANDSLEAGIELMLGAALRRELAGSGRFELVEKTRDDGYAVRGRVADVETVGRTFTPGVRALEYTVTVQLELTVSGPGGQSIAIDPFAQQATEVYLASTDVQLGRKNRDEALRRLAGMLAARIRRELERELDRSTAPSPAPSTADGAAGGPGRGPVERLGRSSRIGRTTS